MLSKVVKVIGITVMIIVGVIAIGIVDNTAVRDAQVYQIDNKIVTFKDSAGNLWDWFIEENESFEKGQKVTLIMDTNKTIDTAEDDVILKIRLDK